MSTFTLISNELGGQFTNRFFSSDWGAAGENISPHLGWQHVPDGTECFAVTMYDPATPTGSGWWHWVLFNIPKDTRELASGAGSRYPELLPRGCVSGLTDFGTPGYGGPVPMPGSGFHPYLLTVHALSAPVPLDAQATPALVGLTMAPLTLAKAGLLIYLHV